MPNIFYSQNSEKELRKLPKNELKKILRKVEILASDPLSGKPLLGELKGYYSLRVWPYRIIYTFTSSEGIIIHSVAHRQNAYN